jgi:hypothetical protein
MWFSLTQFLADWEIFVLVDLADQEIFVLVETFRTITLKQAIFA